MGTNGDGRGKPGTDGTFLFSHLRNTREHIPSVAIFGREKWPWKRFAFISKRTGLLFQTSTGRAHNHSNVRNRMLYPILKEMGVAQTGFHGFRRFRATHLRKQQAPESLIKAWLGHSAQTSVTDLYNRSQADAKYRKQVAEQMGIGFEIPPIVLFVLKTFRKGGRCSLSLTKIPCGLPQMPFLERGEKR